MTDMQQHESSTGFSRFDNSSGTIWSDDVLKA